MESTTAASSRVRSVRSDELADPTC